MNIVHHHDHHHLLDDVLCPLRAANAGLYHLVQLGGHEDRLDNAGDGHAKGGPALAKLAAEDALAGRRVFPLTTKFIGVINRHAVMVVVKENIFQPQIFLGMPPFQKSAVFLNIVQKAFDPPPPFI